MRKRKLGTSGVELSAIGLGAWAMGGEGWAFGWGPQDERESIDTIHRALDLGINWIDTAPVYGHGASEQVVGKAIAGRRDEVIIATKCGLLWDPGEWDSHANLKKESIRREAEASLRRLNIAVIDLYQVHWPNPDEDIEEAWGAIAGLIQEGKVRYAGASNFNIEQLRRVQAIHPIASLQPPYSMLRRGVEAELLDYCAAQGIGVIPYSPMQSGLLTGKYTRQRITELAPGDWRRRGSEFSAPRLGANLALVDGLRRIADAHGRTAAQLAVAWVLRRPEVTSAIVGARRPAQIEALVPAAGWGLSGEVLAEIDALLKQRDQAIAAKNA
jgi:aryl-alcohol dehydrogenase-like predicted oxidoreductase